ncbi:S8 family serine peptidase [Halobellus litoreus]|uniref:S8 family serine peptidase n=1 Tax=Halobellus litoreus TaxID=755310 RepID=A0ABD6DXF8_9EURY|nr:S8 family serine peptidase [Halobellus litoreus]
MSLLLILSSGAVTIGAGATSVPGGGAGPGDGIATIHPTLSGDQGSVEVIVRLQEADIPSGADREEVIELLQAHAEETQEPIVAFAEDRPGIRVVNQFWLTNAVLVEVDTSRVPLRTVANLPEVREIHPNYAIYRGGVTRAEPVSIDRAETVSVDAVRSADTAQPAADLQVIGTTTETTWGVERVNAPAVWDQYGTTGEGVVVAVLDTGIDASHPDIDLYTTDPTDPTYPGGWAEFDAAGFRVADSEPYDADLWYGHGTHVSGTVAGGAASGTAIGVAPGVALLHGSVLNVPIYDDTGTAVDVAGSATQQYAGMQWAVLQGADIISLSLGGLGYWAGDLVEVRNAEAAGVLVVAAIGNTGPGTSGSPGNVYEALSVGASDPNDGIASFSSGEVITTSASWGNAPSDWPEQYVVPRVAAPGQPVLSAQPGGDYAELQGTSMATPHVSGVSALLIASTRDDPVSTGSPSPAEIRDVLATTATKPVGAPTEPDPRYGAGIVDALAAAELLVDGATVVEPNDDFDTASPLSFGAPVTTDLDVADVDVFVVQAQPGEMTVSYVPAPGVTAVALYGPDREMIAFEFVGGSAPVELSATADVAGPYYVQVVNVEDGVGTYTVRVDGSGLTPPDPPAGDSNEPNDDPSQATALPIGETVTGEVSDPDDPDWFVFEVQTEGPIEFDFARTGDGTGTLTVTFLDAQGQPISSDIPFLSGESDTITGTLPADTYYVLVGSGSDDGVGPYDLTYVDLEGPQPPEPEPPGADPNEPNDDPSQATALPIGETVTGEVADPNDPDWFAFEVQADGPVEFDFARTGGGTGTLTVTFLDAQGQPISDDIPFLPDEFDSIAGTLPAGTYYVLVGSGSDDGVGPYELTYVESDVPDGDSNEPNDDPSQATALQSGVPVTGVISTPDDPDWFVFQTDPGAVQFQLTRPAGEGSGTLDFLFLNGQGQPIGVFPVAVGGVEPISGTLAGGTYYIAVESGTDDGVGPYSIEFAETESNMKLIGDLTVSGLSDIEGADEGAEAENDTVPETAPAEDSEDAEPEGTDGAESGPEQPDAAGSEGNDGTASGDPADTGTEDSDGTESQEQETAESEASDTTPEPPTENQESEESEDSDTQTPTDGDASGDDADTETTDVSEDSQSSGEGG